MSRCDIIDNKITYDAEMAKEVSEILELERAAIAIHILTTSVVPIFPCEYSSIEVDAARRLAIKCIKECYNL